MNMHLLEVHIHLCPYRHFNELHRPVGSCKYSEEILVMPMSPASSSTLIHQFLVRGTGVEVNAWAYILSPSPPVCRSLLFFHIREIRSATSRCNSDHNVARRAFRPSYMDSAVAQSTWRGVILTEGTCTDSVMEGQRCPLNTLSHSHAFN